MIIIYFYGTGILTQGFHLEPFHQLCFEKGFFKIGYLELFTWSRLQTAILLTSAS
jgi:hypothetical protein